MIYAELLADKSGELQGFRLTGHAGFAPAGEDIVCAGVSALVQAIICSLQRFLSQQPEIKREENGENLLEVVLPDLTLEADRIRAKVLLETLEIGLTGIFQGYPDYIKIRRCRL